MGVGQLSESDAVDALRLPFYSSSHPTGSHGWRNQFDLGNPDLDFLAALLRTKEAWFEVSYKDGRKEVRRWDAPRMSRSSNVIGNLRSRPEFRAGNWQNKGIASLRVSIERPRSEDA